MKKLDCLGDICPVPILKLQKNLEAIQNGQPVLIITDHSCTLSSVKDFCKGRGLTYSAEEVITGVWEIVVSSRSYL